ncbi:MAG: hypothetical protein Q4E75_05020 [bacterium]|nr:hypothetical protein [bacterium]
MSNYCAHCTYLKLDTGDYNGKFYCDKKGEWHLATDVECYRFCRAYSRDDNSIKNAIEYSNSHSSSGCYLTTMICDILKLDDNNMYLNTLRGFRKNILQKDDKYKAMLVEYDIIGPKISEALKNDPLKEKIALVNFENYIKKIKVLIDNKENENAINLYKQMTNNLKVFYNINDNVTTLQIDNADIKASGHGIYKQKKLQIN